LSSDRRRTIALHRNFQVGWLSGKGCLRPVSATVMRLLLVEKLGAD
jgi:hypothetical protein